MKLQLQGIMFKYKKREVLNNINLEFTSGNIYYIRGENGAGKTTLANIIAGLIAPNSGNVLIDGTVKSDEELRTLYSTTLVQNNISFEIFSLIELLDFYKISYDAENYTRLIDNLGVTHLENTKLSEVSGGEKQRLMLVLVLLLDKPILILDEFENNLDAESIEFIHTEISSLNKIVIIISHKNISNNINYYDLDNNITNFKNKHNETILVNKKIAGKHKLYKNYVKKYKMGLLGLSLLMFIISLFVIGVGFDKIDYIINTQVSNPEAAENTQDDVIVAFSPIVAKYDKNEAYHMLDYSSSDDLFFDYEDIVKLKESPLVEEIVIIPSVMKGSNSTLIENRTIKPTNLVYDDIEYMFENLIIPKDIFEDIPNAFYYGDIIISGEYPDDYSNQILVPYQIADYLIEMGTINTYEDLVGEIVTLDVMLCDENVICETPSTMDFEVSGISDYTMILYSYQNDNISIENQGYLMLQDPLYNEEDVYQVAYDNANMYYEYQGEELDYEEFKQNNSDLIEGVYIKVKNPEDVVEVQNAILNSYPYTVLTSKEIFSKPPPLYTTYIPIKQAVKQIVILLLILIFVLFVVFRTFFKKQYDFYKVTSIVGIGKKEIFRLMVLEYILVFGIPSIISLILSIFIWSGHIHTLSFVWFIIVIIISFLILVLASTIQKIRR